MASAALSLLGFGPASTATSRQPLSVEQRIAAQKAIEQVYWAHRIWPKENPQPKPSLAQVMPDTAIQAKVEDALRKSSALETYWQRPITGEQLQAEINRVGQSTKQPAILSEQFSALSNDPHLIAETVARPILADRLIRNWYATDDQFHGALRSQAESELAGVRDSQQLQKLSGQYREIELINNDSANAQKPDLSTKTVRMPPPPSGASRSKSTGPSSSTSISHANVVAMTQSEWSAALQSLRSRFGGTDLAVGTISSLQEDSERFYVTAILSREVNRLKVAEVSWQKVPFDQWWAGVKGSQPMVPSQPSYSYTLPSLTNNSANQQTATSNARINSPAGADDTWMATKAPLVAERNFHSAVWTGTEMIVWGGAPSGLPATDTGGRYNPSTDSWTATTLTNVPRARLGHTAVWSGTEMIIWGGDNGTGPMGDASNYNLGPGAYALNDGARYNPATDSWTTLPATGAPTQRLAHTGVWTGSEMIVWGGFGCSDSSCSSPAYLANGARYNPSTNSWVSSSTLNSGPTNPSGRIWHSAIWTASEMIVWGGLTQDTVNGFEYLDDGGRYSPSTDTWVPVTTPASNVPGGRGLHSAVWTGSEMIIWGGHGCGSTVTQPCSYGSGNDVVQESGGRYNPMTNTWTAVHITSDTPQESYLHTAIWTGSKMVTWGGINGSNQSLNSGGQYDPTKDGLTSSTAWSLISTTNAPFARWGHTALWSGSEMIVWGGEACPDANCTQQTAVSSGGRYNPQSDSWVATAIPPALNAPSPRSHHTAVWTGSEMIIWGGTAPSDTTVVGTGAAYDPVTDNWTPTSLPGNMHLRHFHTAIWTGNEMIVWGGADCTDAFSCSSGGETNTGARYNPATNAWTATDLTNAPDVRAHHTAVWTGNEMIVWGGSNSAGPLNTGGRYNPNTDSWSLTNNTNAPSPRLLATAVWSGQEMIVWGGVDLASDFRTGGRYSPTTDSWNPTSTSGAPIARSTHSAIWAGSKMIVWGGSICGDPSAGGCDDDFVYPPNTPLNDGAVYDPGADNWTPITALDAPSARTHHTAVWTGQEMIIWGGLGMDSLGLPLRANSGARYNPQIDEWTPTSLLSAPTARDLETAVWTGNDMIVWGGIPYASTGGRYHVVLNQPPQLVSAVSRKVHANGTFDINLPLAGYPGIECRSGGPNGNHQVVLTFAVPVTYSIAVVSKGVGTVSSSNASGNQVTVNLTGVTDAQIITIRLNNVSDGSHTGFVAVRMGVLLGDVNGDGIVDGTDLSQTQAQFGNATTASNFRDDINLDGTITPADAALVSAASGNVALAGTWSLFPSPSNNAKTNLLASVTCVSLADCWAVGSSTFSTTPNQTLTEHWNGTAWSIVSSANSSPSQNNTLSGVTCNSTSDCWAVGEYFVTSNPQHYETLIEHWNGGAWSTVPSANVSTAESNILRGIACALPNECWAVGYHLPGAQYQPLLEKWDGTSWTIAVPPVVTNGTSNQLFSVTCTSVSDCWTVGEADLVVSGISHTLAAHWDGNAWNVVTTPDTNNRTNSLLDVTCTSASDCWAVGDAEDTSNFILYTLIEHWDGSAWTIVPSPNPTSWDSLQSVSCPNANDCWAVGYQDTDYATQTLIVHWDGQSWTAIPSPDTSAAEANLFNDVACASASECWAVGYRGSGNGTLLAEFSTTVRPLQLINAVSRKTHGNAGTFDIDLPLTGNPAIECRTGGTSGNHEIVFTFATPVRNVTSASVILGNGATGSISGTPMISGNQITVNLTNVSNAQILSIVLFGVSDGTNTTNVSASMAVLLGDVTADGQVDSGDLIKVKQQTLQPVDDSNFREDVNTDGNIDSSDLIITKRQTLTGLP
jgi:N-acetylneuraminic acid mutarotase